MLNKCDIYYATALITKEAIIEKYLAFFASSLVSKERSVNFALHTGSICFDVISLVAVSLGCLSYNLSTNEDIVLSLQTDDMVMYKGKRYRWKGMDQEDGQQYMVIEQDGRGKNGRSTTHLPLESHKHLIKPYHGDSQLTDGRGVKRTMNRREKFLAYAFDVEITEIPTQIDVSIVVVANREDFSSLSKEIVIEYKNGERIGLLDIVPASYYTSGGEQYQFGSNPTKAEAVLKVTSHVSTARELVLKKFGNKVVGLLVQSGVAITENGSELADLLRRQVLRFAHVTSTMKPGLGEHILELYEDASIFACTKEYIKKNSGEIQVVNSLTNELHRQFAIAIESSVTSISIAGGWSWSELYKIKNSLLAIKQSNIPPENKDAFIIAAYGLINLLNTSIFPIRDMENIIIDEKINQSVISPRVRIRQLWEIADRTQSMQEAFIFVADALERKYEDFLEISPKALALDRYMKSNNGSSIAIIVPKAYYSAILTYYHPEYFSNRNIVCCTPSRFDSRRQFDSIIVVGNFKTKYFDPLQYLGSRNINVLLFEGEQMMFNYRKKSAKKIDDRLNQRIGVFRSSDSSTLEDYEIETGIIEEIATISTIEEYFENIEIFNVMRFLSSNSSHIESSSTSEVTHIGSFITGEQIFFSKYYSAVVYDPNAGTVLEKSVEKLLAGDVLVFILRTEYTKNIVDVIFEKLLYYDRLGQDSIENYEKSIYWKEILRAYKKSFDYSYRKIAKEMKKLGSSLKEVTIRQWLVEDSHIVGPRDENTMKHIGLLTQDELLLDNYQEYFEACRFVRRLRRKILKLIGTAISEKLQGRVPSKDSDLKIVFENVESLSETLELSGISKLEEVVNINMNLVNKPITDVEGI